MAFDWWGSPSHFDTICPGCLWFLFVVTQRWQNMKKSSLALLNLSPAPPLLRVPEILLLAWVNTLPLHLWGFSIPWSVFLKNAWHLQGIGTNNQLEQTDRLKSRKLEMPWMLQPGSNECCSLKKQVEIHSFSKTDEEGRAFTCKTVQWLGHWH